MVKIMLVEDDSTMVSLLTTLLAMEGFEVRVPNSPNMQGLINDFIRESPSLALVDVNLHIGSGLDLVQQIRQNQETRDTSILMFSGLDFNKEAHLAGADGFILKPFMPDELVHRIHTVLQPDYKVYQEEKGK